MKNYLKEFPDFDNIEVFEEIEKRLSDCGFSDHSWHNDTNPSLQIHHGEKEVKVFVSYKENDPDMNTTFVVFGYNWETCEEINLTETNDIDDAVKSALESKEIIFKDDIENNQSSNGPSI